MKRVLIIEDDRDIVDLVSIHLRDIPCEVSFALTGNEGLKLAQQRNFDLIVLDVLLPGVDGIEICRRLRADGKRTPILMLTARSEEIDKVLGLEIGADDYLTKPFSVREFLARVKALFRRMEFARQEPSGGAISSFGELEIDRDSRKVLRAGQRIDLTPKEFDLLSLLAKHPGRTYSRQQILDLVWNYEFAGYEHTVNSHVNRLRAKIESDPQHPTYILTTWGVGYRFNDQV